MTKSFGKRLGALIKHHRMLEDLSQWQLAMESLDHDAEEKRVRSLTRRIADIEGGKVVEPRMTTIGPLCARLGITRNDLEDLRRPEQRLHRQKDDRETASYPSLPLSDPPASNNISNFSARSLGVLGRTQEMQRLAQFAKDPRMFLWLQLAGDGGQGKSRLAYEFVLSQRSEGWFSGFVDDEALRTWSGACDDWKPECPCLIVFDYVIGREQGISKAFRALAKHRQFFEFPVRLLLLERQRWDRGGLSTHGSSSRSRTVDGPMLALGARATAPEFHSEEGSFGLNEDSRANWFLEICDRYDGRDNLLSQNRFENGVISLQGLSANQLVEISRQVAARREREIPLSDDDIALRLSEIDGSGRPLYAYFFGLVAASEPTNQVWAKGRLLDMVLNREHATRWRASLNDQAPSLADDDDAVRLAALACICREIDCRRLSGTGNALATDSSTRRRALTLVNSSEGSAVRGPSQVISSLQPDLLGEWFVLSVLENETDRELLLASAWSYAPNETAAFLQRLAQDFPEHETSKAMFAWKPPTDEGLSAYQEVAAQIAIDINPTKRDLPQSLVEVLLRAADDDDGRAMAALGLAAYYGNGLPKDASSSHRWFVAAAEAGHTPSMQNAALGFLYGWGCEKKTPEAIRLLEAGAEAGHGGCMQTLGTLYKAGEVIPKDVPKAIKLFEDGAEVGSLDAMNSLADSYRGGTGKGVNLPLAFHWSSKAAELGSVIGMEHKGISYGYGEGVEKDLHSAVRWLRNAATLGHHVAFDVLFSLIGSQTGAASVELKKAHVDWLSRQANNGNARAVNWLGVLYLLGDFASKDSELGINLIEQAAHANDARAFNTLGVCHRFGLGRNVDEAAARKYFQNGSELDDQWATLNHLIFDARPEEMIVPSPKQEFSTLVRDAHEDLQLFEKLLFPVKVSPVARRLYRMAQRVCARVSFIHSKKLFSAILPSHDPSSSIQIILAKERGQIEYQMPQVLQMFGTFRQIEQLLMGYFGRKASLSNLEMANIMHTKMLDHIVYICKVGKDLLPSHAEEVYEAIDAFGYREIFDAELAELNDEEVKEKFITAYYNARQEAVAEELENDKYT